MMQVDARTHFFPYHRNEKYPRYMSVDFRKLKTSTLKKYVEQHDLPLRSDSTPAELAIACARHFESHLEVEEESVLPRFMNAARRIPPPSIAESSTMTKRSARRGEVGTRDMISTDEAVAAAEDDDGLDRRERRGEGRAGEERRGGERRGEGRWGFPSEDSYGRSAAPGSKRMRREEAPPYPPAARGHPAVSGAERRGEERGGQVGGGLSGAQGHSRRQEACVQDAETDGGGEGMEGTGEEADTTLYCHCQRQSFGEMIACDNADCPIEWFHLGCVGLTASNRPRGKWYCKDCRHYDGPEDPEGDYKRPSLNPPRKRQFAGGAAPRRTSSGGGGMMQRSKVAIRSSAIPGPYAQAAGYPAMAPRRPVGAAGMAPPYAMPYSAMGVPMAARSVPQIAGTKRR